jgi:hypothetical protein
VTVGRAGRSASSVDAASPRRKGPSVEFTHVLREPPEHTNH